MTLELKVCQGGQQIGNLQHMDLTVLVSYAVWLRVFSSYSVEVLVEDLSAWVLSQTNKVLDWHEAISHLSNQLMIQTKDEGRRFSWSQLLSLDVGQSEVSWSRGFDVGDH